MRKGLFGATVTGWLVVAFLGCGSPGGSGGSAEDLGSASTKITDKPVTLTVWDTENEPGPTAEITKLNQEFQDAHPNVTIKRVVRQFNDYTSTVKLAASSANPPDVLQGNEGYSVDGPLVQAHLIAPLDSYAKLYGWDTRFGSPAVLDPLRWGQDGRTWGQDNDYGVAQKAEVIGAFYSKRTFDRLGLKKPTTFAEFEHTLAVAKKGGVTPIMVGNLDKWPMGHVFMALQSLYAPASEISDWTFGRSGATFDTKGTREAADKLAEWAQNGYFESGFNGVSQEDAAGRFAKGEGLYFITGPWENQTFAGPMGDNVGFFVIPPVVSSHDTTTGALSLPYHISSRSENPDVAAAYIDFITSRQAAPVVLQKGDLPAVQTDAGKAVDPKSSLASIVGAWQAKSAANKLTPYLDWATPSMGDTLFSGLQDLTAGQIDSGELISRVQDDWSNYQRK
jgi:raffinose/stachyose/melibiose transport system substrate-binding protein